MIHKRLRGLWQRWRHRHMIAAINILGRLNTRELGDIADYALERYKRKLRKEAQL